MTPQGLVPKSKHLNIAMVAFHVVKKMMSGESDD
jgi:hypothetical protein